jgi:hypothetical protein
MPHLKEVITVGIQKKNLKKNIKTVIDIFMESCTNNFPSGLSTGTVSNNPNIYFTKLSSL